MIENVIKELHLPSKSYNTARVFACFLSHCHCSKFQTLFNNRASHHEKSTDKENNKPSVRAMLRHLTEERINMKHFPRVTSRWRRRRRPADPSRARAGGRGARCAGTSEAPHFDGSMADKLCGVQSSTLLSEMTFCLVFYLICLIFSFLLPTREGQYLQEMMYLDKTVTPLRRKSLQDRTSPSSAS